MTKHIDHETEDQLVQRDTRVEKRVAAILAALLLGFTLFLHVLNLTFPSHFTAGNAVAMSFVAILVTHFHHRLVPAHVIGALVGFYVACLCFLYGALELPADHAHYRSLQTLTTTNNGGASAKAPPFAVQN